MDTSTEETGLGNLAQSARTKQLKSARAIMFFVGVITIVANAGFMIAAETLVDREIEKEVANLRGQNMIVDQAAVAEFRETAVRSTRLVNGIGLLIGIVFIGFGFTVYRYPVPITVTALVMYIGCWAVYGVIDPTTLASGWIVKILIVVALFKAVQAALAYEHERKLAVPEPSPQTA